MITGMTDFENSLAIFRKLNFKLYNPASSLLDRENSDTSALGAMH